MKQVFTIIALSLSLAMPAAAQFSVGASVAPAIPLGDFSRLTNFGFGLGIDGRYTIGEQLSFGLGVSWYNFSSGFDDTYYRITPITATIEYFFRSIKTPTPYVGLDLGSYAYSFRAFGFRVSDPFFGFSPTLGVLYPLSEQLSFDGNVQYSLVFSDLGNTSYVPINLGIRYNFLQ